MRREEFLVTRLMRQSQQERRIATQLLQLRHEKAVIQQNRISRQEQYEQRRQRDFQEALDKEAVCTLCPLYTGGSSRYVVEIQKKLPRT